MCSSSALTFNIQQKELTPVHSRLLTHLHDKSRRNTTSDQRQWLISHFHWGVMMNVYFSSHSKAVFPNLLTIQANNHLDIFSEVQLENIFLSNCHPIASSQMLPVNRVLWQSIDQRSATVYWPRFQKHNVPIIKINWKPRKLFWPFIFPSKKLTFCYACT